jgi:hypothetical protein
MKAKFTIKIDKEITEQLLIENCLNMVYSGYDSYLELFFYALANSWHVNKIVYYLRLIEEARQEVENEKTKKP